MAQPLWLRIEGARQNNLKNVSLAIPHDRVTVITGVSGSGKSSLAFDTVFAEGQWRYIESLSAYARMFLERLDRPDVDRIEHIRPAIALEQKNPVRTARSTVGTATELHDYLRLLFAKVGRVHCPRCDSEARSDSAERVADELVRDHAGARAMVCFPLPPQPRPDPRAFMAALLQRGFARIKIGETLVDLAESQGEAAPVLDGQPVQVVLDRVVVGPEARRRLTESLETALAEGDGRAVVDVVGHGPLSVSREFRCPRCEVALARPQPLLFSFNHPLGACPECKGFGNILRYDEALVVPDPTVSIADGAVEPWSHPSGRWYQERLLRHANKLGVDVPRPYAALAEADREWIYAGGEGLTGIQGFFEEVESYRYKLHVRVFLSRYRSQSPCPRCAGARLKPEALTVRVGGATIAEWNGKTVEELYAFLSALGFSAWEEAVGREALKLLRAKLSFLQRVGLGYLTLGRQTRTLSGGEAQRINLANQLGAQLVGTLYVLDEPSIGLHARDTERLAELCRELAQVGNTALIVEHDRPVHDTLYRALARHFKVELARAGSYDEIAGIEFLKGVRLIDQEPIGRTPRSNPVTYVKAFDEIRKLFAGLPRAKSSSLSPGAFSFNVPGGRCETCQGDGFQKLEMYFFEDVYVTCQDCEGRRYRPEVLQVTYKGRNISQVLQQTIDEAVEFFAGQPVLARRLKVLQEVGLGYLRLGQPATTLSGGEAQRLKIAAELSTRLASDFLYILDEPTTGLHLDDVKKLLVVLNRLVDSSSTVLVVEHHLDVIKTADWVIDLGPDGGAAGGEIVAEGTPEQIAQTDGSYTGKFLRELLPRFDGKHTGRRTGKPGVARGA